MSFFLRSNIEQNYSKLFDKLAKQVSSYCVNGTFAPIWQVMKTSVEQLSLLHMQMVQKITDLVKEVNKYADELHKKHKMVRKPQYYQNIYLFYYSHPWSFHPLKP